MYDGAGRLRVGGGFSMGDTIFSSKEGEGRIGGDVVSYVEYTIALFTKVQEKKFVVLATGFWASLTVYTFFFISATCYPTMPSCLITKPIMTLLK